MCCNCPTPDELYRSIDRAIDEGRWFYTGVVVGPPEQRKWLYTVGLAERFDHPELLVTGICCGECGWDILNPIAERVAAGERFDAATVEPIELRGHPLHVRVVRDECWESSWLAMWKGYYESKPYLPPPARAMQVVYADRRGRFPWELGCDPDVAIAQQLPDEPPPPVGNRAARRRARRDRRCR